MSLRRICAFVLTAGLLTASLISGGHSKKDIEAMAAAPRRIQIFPMQYCIALPDPDPKRWEADYEAYLRYTTAKIRQQQCGMTYIVDSVETTICVGSPMPHAQLDTATIIRDKNQLEGTWRVVSHKQMRFQDSMSDITQQIYRTDSLLKNLSQDDGFAVFGNGFFQLYARPAGQRKFKTLGHAGYELVNGRYLTLSKYFRIASGLSQIGIDSEGRLVSHYATFMEQKRRGSFIVYTSVIEQIVFEKVQL